MLSGKLRTLLACLAPAVALGLAAPASAETPKDTFVMAKDISDIITLDPAEVFELSGGEMIAQIYDRVMMYEPEDLKKLVGGVVESWEISEDGHTITFKMRPGQTFHSGNPVTAEDVEFSLERVVKLNKTPSFIVTQFGWTEDNVEEMVEAPDADTVVLKIPEDLSPGLVLNALTAGIASVVDKKLVMEHAQDGDLGYDWLKTNSAGSGAFSLRSWKANETVVLDAFEDYRHGAPGMKRVIVRHVAEPSAQRLLLEKGDVDIARNLTPDQVAGLEDNPDIVVDDDPKGTVAYMAANQSDEILGKPGVVDALRWLVDYAGMADSFLRGQWVVHQSFWPSGLWASYDETPYTMNVEKAKAALEKAGVGDGFEIRIDTLTASPFPEIAQAIQAGLAQAGIEAEIVTQEGKTLWPMYRARKHQLILARWSPDYVDPHSNADSFARNPDNSAEAKLTGVLAWRNAWQDEKSNEMVTEAATSLDLEKREQIYLDLQKMLQEKGPYVIMFQTNEQNVRRKNVEGFVSGPTFDLVFYRNVTKG